MEDELRPFCLRLPVGNVNKEAVVDENDEIKVVPRMKVCATFDHRVLDGMRASRARQRCLRGYGTITTRRELTVAVDGFESVPEHLRASVLELAGELAEDDPDRSSDQLLEDAARAVLRLEAEQQAERRRVAWSRRRSGLMGVLRAAVFLLGVSGVFWVMAQPSSRDQAELLHQERSEMLQAVPLVVERQAELVAPLVMLGADEELLRQSAVPMGARLDEQLEMAMELQKLLELEHSAVVPSTAEELAVWNEQLDELDTVRHALRLLDLRVQLNAKRQAKASSR